MPQEPVIPFPARARSLGEPEQLARRRRAVPDGERPTPVRRTARRRRQQSPWLQRHALSIAALSLLVALLGVGFGLLQVINRPSDANQALLALPQPEPGGTTLAAAAVGPTNPIGPVPFASAGASASTSGGPAAREIVSSARVLEPNYTIASGDTLGKIAVRFNTSVERIQALNNLADPRALRIGTKLVIPPPL